MIAEPYIDENFKQFATPQQAAIIDALNLHGSARLAGNALNLSRSTIRGSIKRVKQKAAVRGYSPQHDLTKIVPEPFVLRGTSTLYGKDGDLKLQWVKSRLDDQKHAEMIRAAYEAMAEELPRLAPLPTPLHAESALANLFTLTDCHVGALCWRREGGEDWDLRIAERVLTECFERMVMSAPSAKIGIVNQLGDFLHTDALAPLTPTSGHLLDADGRFSKIVDVAVRILRRLVDITLQRHEIVHVLMMEGNHDPAGSIWLRVLFRALYENEPRVRVYDSPLPYVALQHGNTMLGFHHGHLSKLNELPILFAAQFPDMWGATRKRYVHTGHRHHVEEKEHSGITIIQHATLTARDAYAARGGWIAERQVTAITYHEKWGQVGRTTVVPEMIEPTK